MTQTQPLPKLASIDRISKIPVIESGFGLASGAYLKIKRSNSLVTWSLDTVEERIHSVVVKSYPLFELPIGVVDTLVCKTLDEVEQRVPAINYPPEQLFNFTKDMVSSKIVEPVLKRADSVKQFSVNNPHLTKYGGLAVSRLDNALDAADEYVDKYLPDSSDAETKGEEQPGDDESKAKRTIQHANRLSRKLKRRLTKRTIEEARALTKTGQVIGQFIYFSVDLLIKDPREFANKMMHIWAHLSEDEPENQIPPANLDQLLALVARETARRLVHAVNYSVVVCGNLPNDIAHLVNTTNHHTMVLLDNVLKTANLEGLRAVALGRAEIEMNKVVTRLNDLYKLVRESLENSKSILSQEIQPRPQNSSEVSKPAHQHHHHHHRKPAKKEKKIPSGNGTTPHTEESLHSS